MVQYILRHSEKLTNLFINHKVISYQEKEVYIYSIELLLSTLINGLLVILISVILKEPLQGFIFVVVFIIMQQLAGGYHAESDLKCILSFSLIFCSFLLLAKALHENWSSVIMIMAFLIVTSLLCIGGLIKKREEVEVKHEKQS